MLVTRLVVATWRVFFLGVRKSIVARSTPPHIATTAYLILFIGADGGLGCCVLT